MSTQTVTKPSLTLKRRLNSPPAKVFSAWTDPEKIKRWFGPGQTQVALVNLARKTKRNAQGARREDEGPPRRQRDERLRRAGAPRA